MENQTGSKRVRDESDESGLDSSEVKRIRDDLLEFLDDTDPAPSIQELDSVMKSLQEEISASSSPVPVVDLTSDSGECQPQYGYLLEASDDELGLPPAGTSSSSATESKKEENNELVRLSSDSSGVGEFWDFEDQIPSYDSFELGTGIGVTYNGNAEYVAFDGLFEHSDVYYDSEFSDPWRHGTLPAQ
ncbi:hypothetical protein L6164_026881 [Bauhinia variegata]|uniref:Uncharacterized protein n=1 Tax=Bauhinia variegata TaxID=167791 RepID=A0ACB9LSZ4_BAUVA|nr:hypothetical protein L6164_026881 [Bauhinia variegata]